MKKLFLPSAESPVFDWILFFGFLVLISLCIGGFIVWMKVSSSSKGTRKRKRRRHHRHTNPTLAETGGLPPMRDPDQPPPGP